MRKKENESDEKENKKETRRSEDKGMWISKGKVEKQGRMEGGERSRETPPPCASNQLPSSGVNELNEPLRPASNSEGRDTH